MNPTQMNPNRRRSPAPVALLATALALIVASLALPAAAQTGQTYFITNVDSSGFPQVSFSLRAIDLANQAVVGLNASNLAVYENGQQVQGIEITPHADGPITYVFVIDQGRVANYTNFGLNNIRSTITTLVSGGYFNDGRDTVLVLGRQNVSGDQTVELLPATQASSDLTTWAANFNFARGSAATKGLLGVEDAISRVNELVPVPGSQTTAIVYVTRYIEDPTPNVAETAAQNTAALARTSYISVHALQTDPNQLRSDALEILAEASNGSYAGIRSSTYLSAATAMYEAIDSQRTYYTVSYRSPVSDSGEHQITINTPERPSEGVIGLYSVELEPPAISIVEPVPGSTVRNEPTYGPDGETLVFETTRIRVAADISWPDGFPRQLESAQLVINGAIEDSIQLEPDQTQLEFSWDLSDVTNVGTNAIELEVLATDELGLEGSTDSNVNVEVILPPTPEPTGIQITPTFFLVGTPLLCVLGVLTAGVVGGVIYLVRRRSGPGVAAADEAPDEVGATVMGPEAVGGLALATLTVIEGPKGLIDEPLKIIAEKTTLGRHPSLTDLSFYADEPSSVSRIHCTIELSDNMFRLIDNNSSGGTRLNGRKIQPDTPVDLADGDEIVMGDLARRGVKLRFNYASPEGMGPYAGTADDRTHYVGDG